MAGYKAHAYGANAGERGTDILVAGDRIRSLIHKETGASAGIREMSSGIRAKRPSPGKNAKANERTLAL
jgi:hypothetical protein